MFFSDAPGLEYSGLQYNVQDEQNSINSHSNGDSKT